MKKIIELSAVFAILFVVFAILFVGRFEQLKQKYNIDEPLLESFEIQK